jgi:hypothetical protein
LLAAVGNKVAKIDAARSGNKFGDYFSLGFEVEFVKKRF